MSNTSDQNNDVDLSLDLDLNDSVANLCSATSSAANTTSTVIRPPMQSQLSTLHPNDSTTTTATNDISNIDLSAFNSAFASLSKSNKKSSFGNQTIRVKATHRIYICTSDDVKTIYDFTAAEMATSGNFSQLLEMRTTTGAAIANNMETDDFLERHSKVIEIPNWLAKRIEEKGKVNNLPIIELPEYFLINSEIGTKESPILIECQSYEASNCDDISTKRLKNTSAALKLLHDWTLLHRTERTATSTTTTTSTNISTEIKNDSILNSADDPANDDDMVVQEHIAAVKKGQKFVEVPIFSDKYMDLKFDEKDKEFFADFVDAKLLTIMQPGDMEMWTDTSNEWKKFRAITYLCQDLLNLVFLHANFQAITDKIFAVFAQNMNAVSEEIIIKARICVLDPPGEAEKFREQKQNECLKSLGVNMELIKKQTEEALEIERKTREEEKIDFEQNSLLDNRPEAFETESKEERKTSTDNNDDDNNDDNNDNEDNNDEDAEEDNEDAAEDDNDEESKSQDDE
jgi:hypothetical protein